jgi:hypothetical protein
VIGATIHLPDSELYRFAQSFDKDAPDHDWARDHLETGCEACAMRLLRFETALAGPQAGIPSWIRPQRVEFVGAQRAGMLADTKLVCGAGPYEVDVLVRQFGRPRGLEFLGQITLAEHLDQPVAGLPLSLVRARPAGVVTDTNTDDFGEFDLASDQSGSHGLRLGIEPDAPCVLVWEEEA